MIIPVCIGQYFRNETPGGYAIQKRAAFFKVALCDYAVSLLVVGVGNYVLAQYF